jgi:alanine racemase
MARSGSPFALIDLAALADNYRILCERARPAAVAAAIKADAYGLGLRAVAQTLFDSGCRAFFVAHFGEALDVRAALPHAVIAVLHGFGPAEFDEALAQNIIPVVNHLEALEQWRGCARHQGHELPAFVHLDTGMNRLGLSPREQERLAADPSKLEGIAVRAWMSHLACADEADHPKTAEQLEAFEAILKKLPKAPASLANSAGIFLGRDYLFDLVRPGAALYGINPMPGRPNPMRGVVTLRAPILQVRRVDPTMTVGYGATHVFPRHGRVAAVALGYADGYPRSLANKAEAKIGDHLVPVIGRVSMDLVTIDISGVPDSVGHPGAMVEFIGPELSIDRVAGYAGTIGYELLTGLGSRIERVYTPA